MMVSERDYTRATDIAAGCERLIAGLLEDGDDPTMYRFFLSLVSSQPDSIVPVVRESIQVAAERLGQDRRRGSSATLLYPIEAAVKCVAAENRLLGDRDPFRSMSWTQEDLIRILATSSRKIIELAGTSTTSKNLPQRAAQMFWLIDNTPDITSREQLGFIELGASRGLILDALRNPDSFRSWMDTQNCLPTQPFGRKLTGKKLPGIGIDLVIPSDKWILATILNDQSRNEVRSFMDRFPRSQVVTGNALDFPSLAEVQQFVQENPPITPMVISCFMLYQLSLQDREKLINTTRMFLVENGGGYFLIADIAKYVGFPEKAGGCVSWIEDETGKRISPQLSLQGDTLTQWTILKETP